MIAGYWAKAHCQPMPTALLKRGGMALLLAAFGVVFTAPFHVSASNVVAWGDPNNLQTNIPPDLTNAVAIGAGSAYGLALLQNGTVRSWGYDYAGAGSVPIGLSNVTAISTGRHHSLALKRDSTVTAWDNGFEEFGQATVPSALSNVIAVAAGGYHSLALTADGTVTGWGNDSYGQRTAPAALSNVVAIAAGGYHSLAVKGDGTLVYWGNQALKNAAIIATLSKIKGVSTGWYHSVALFMDGTIFAWNTETGTEQTVPSGLTNVIAISCGTYHTLALKADGSVVAWGLNTDGQTNVPAGLTSVRSVAGGDTFSAALIGEQDLNVQEQPVNFLAVVGETATFLATASGNPPISWQWLRDGVPLPDETNNVLQLKNVQMAQSGVYSAIVSNIFASKQTDVAALSVLPLIITEQPVSESVYGGELAQFGVESRHVGPISYEWRYKGSPVLGATNVYFVINNAGTNDAGPYSVVVSNASGSVTSAIAILNVTPLVITVQPTNVASFSGDRASFFVVPWKNGPFTGQWRFRGVDIPGTTNLSLMITNLSTNDAGNYTIAVSNPYGVVESSNATLTVIESPPIITAQPTNDFAFYFGSASLVVVATGSKPLSYQWRFNEQEVPGATNALLGLSGVTTNQSGNYSVIVSNSVGSTLSSNALLTVVPVVIWGTNLPPRPPSSLTNAIGISAAGAHSLILQSNGNLVFWGVTECPQPLPVLISNVMNLSAGYLTDIVVHSNGVVQHWGCSMNPTSTPPGLSNVVAVQTGPAYFLVLKSDGTVASWGSSLVITGSPFRSVVAVASGQNFNVALKVDGTVAAWGAFNYRQTLIPPNLSNVVAIACGDYHSLALKADGTVESWGASASTNGMVNLGQTNVPAGLANVIAISASDMLSSALKTDGTVVSWGRSDSHQTSPPAGLSNVWAVASHYYYSVGLLSSDPIRIARHPMSAIAGKGERALLSVGVVSAVPVSYQWQRNGHDLPSATNSVFVIAAANTVDEGTYHVVVSNQFGLAISRDATILLGLPPFVVIPPANQAIQSPGVVTFSVMATSTFPLSYQWRKSFNISGATNRLLTLGNLHRASGGYYSVTVTNLFGTTNVEARLRVIEPQTLSALTVATNGDVTFTARDSLGDPLAASDIPFCNVWASTNLVDWELTQASITVESNGIFTIHDPAAGNLGHRFYRMSEALTTRIPAPQRLTGPYSQADGSMTLFSSDSTGLRLNAGDLASLKFLASSNLTDWVVLTNSIVVSNGVLILQDRTAKDFPNRFYRAEEQR
jgi:alpha-tubulin suppressor-like RCC1 family protein